MIRATVRGGVCAAGGFFCGSVACGIKDPEESRDDTAQLISQTPCSVRGYLHYQSRQGGAGPSFHGASQVGEYPSGNPQQRKR